MVLALVELGANTATDSLPMSTQGDFFAPLYSLNLNLSFLKANDQRHLESLFASRNPLFSVACLEFSSPGGVFFMN